MSGVLLVDGDEQVRSVLRISLSARGYDVAVAADGNSTLRIAADIDPQLVLLHLGLPDIDGIEVIRTLRGWTEAPIIAMSETADPEVKVRALDVGADDYVTRPFDMSELLARIRVALRRAASTGDRHHSIVDTASFSVDLNRKAAWRDGAEVRLTPTEWALLEILVRAVGRWVTQEELLRTVRGAEHVRDAHYLRVHLGQLRRKLEPVPARPRHLTTAPGKGYRFTLHRAD